MSGLSKKCKICTSSYREEIEYLRFVKQMELHDIVNVMRAKYNAKLSRTTVHNHCKHTKTFQEIQDKYTEKCAETGKVMKIKEFVPPEDTGPTTNPKEKPEKKANTPYKKKEDIELMPADLAVLEDVPPEVLIRDVVNYNLQEIGKLDNMMNEDYSLYKKIIDQIHWELQEYGRPSRDNVALLATINTNICRSAETKQKLMGTDAQGRAASAVENWVGLLGMVDE